MCEDKLLSELNNLVKYAHLNTITSTFGILGSGPKNCYIKLLTLIPVFLLEGLKNLDL